MIPALPPSVPDEVLNRIIDDRVLDAVRTKAVEDLLTGESMSEVDGAHHTSVKGTVTVHQDSGRCWSYVFVVLMTRSAGAGHTFRRC